MTHETQVRPCASEARPAASGTAPGWLRQLFHLAGRDLRRARWMVAGWVGVVAVLVAAESAAQGGGMSLPGIGLLLFFGAAGMSAWLVQADPPRREGAYWATLPLEPLALLAAKAGVAFLVGGGVPLVGHAVALHFWALDPGWILHGLWRGALAAGAGVTLGLVLGAATTSLAGAAAPFVGTVVTMLGVSAVHMTLMSRGGEAAGDVGLSAPPGLLALLLGPVGALLAGAFLVLVYRSGRQGRGALLLGGILALGAALAGLAAANPQGEPDPRRALQDAQVGEPPAVALPVADSLRVDALEIHAPGGQAGASAGPGGAPSEDTASSDRMVALRLAGPRSATDTVHWFLPVTVRLVDASDGTLVRTEQGTSTRYVGPPTRTAGMQSIVLPWWEDHEPLVRLSGSELDALRAGTLRLEFVGHEIRSTRLVLPPVPLPETPLAVSRRSFAGGQLGVGYAPPGSGRGVSPPPEVEPRSLGLTLRLVGDPRRPAAVGLVWPGVARVVAMEAALAAGGTSRSLPPPARDGSSFGPIAGAGILAGLPISEESFTLPLPGLSQAELSGATLHLTHWQVESAAWVRLPVPRELWETLLRDGEGG
jgi:hypothetical protein